MSKTQIDLFLASSSPRRRKLLKILNIPYRSFSIEADESVLEKERPINAVKRITKNKLEAAKEKNPEGTIIVADTIVVLNGKIIGKPQSKSEAVKFLNMLSGETHAVYTGIGLYNFKNKKEILDYEKTYVEFYKLDNAEIKRYVETGSPMDKAGAYGIQDDYGALFVKKITGCYYNVVGLPLAKLYHRLKEIR